MKDPIRQVDRWSYFHFTSGEIGSRRKCDFPKVTPLLSGGLGTGGRGLLSVTGGQSELWECPPPHPRTPGPALPPAPCALRPARSTHRRRPCGAARSCVASWRRRRTPTARSSARARSPAGRGGTRRAGGARGGRAACSPPRRPRTCSCIQSMGP